LGLIFFHKRNDMKTYIMPEDLLMALGNYLARLPYAEVKNIIQGLENLKENIVVDNDRAIKEVE
jgi:hypothetical protein